MALKAVLDSIDDIDDILKGEYTEKDGKFYLSVDNIDAHPQVVALKNAHERTKSEKTTLKTELDSLKVKFKDIPEDFTIDEWHRLLTADGIDPNDPEAKKKRKEKVDEQLTNLRKTYEQQIENLKTKYSTDIADKDKTIETERAARAKDKIELDLDKAMDKANIDPKFRSAVRALHKDSVKYTFEEDGSIRTYVESNLGEVEPTAYLDSWAQSDDGKPFAAVAVGPGGKQVNNGGQQIANNPFSAQSWNKTQQASLRNDPVKGERLARAAGFNDLASALGATKPISVAK